MLAKPEIHYLSSRYIREAPSGEPQIEISFDVRVDGFLYLSAIDKDKNLKMPISRSYKFACLKSNGIDQNQKISEDAGIFLSHPAGLK